MHDLYSPEHPPFAAAIFAALDVLTLMNAGKLLPAQSSAHAGRLEASSHPVGIALSAISSRAERRQAKNARRIGTWKIEVRGGAASEIFLLVVGLTSAPRTERCHHSHARAARTFVTAVRLRWTLCPP